MQILRNDDDGSEKGSLVWLLDNCTTKFGGRLLRDWVVHPLVQHAAILERQDAVQELLAAQQSGDPPVADDKCSRHKRWTFP